MKKLLVLIPIIVFAVAVLFINYHPEAKQITIVKKEFPKYKAVVQVYKNGKLIAETHNLLTNIGKEFIEDQLTNPSTNTTKYISLSTGATDCSESATVLANEITTAGLARAEGTVTDTGTGNFTVEKTFIATGSVSDVQVAGLHWYSSGDDNLFACANFTSVNLEANDELTIRWIVTIS